MKTSPTEPKVTGQQAEHGRVQSKTSTTKLVKAGSKVEGCHSILPYLKKEYGLTEEQIYRLSMAVTPANIQGRPGLLVRVFDPANKLQGVEINGFDSLNEHPELILYEGYCSGSRRGIPDEIRIEKRAKGPSFLEQKLQDGCITEVGMKAAPTPAMKWLGRVGRFLMYGGWLLLAVVGVGIAIAISMIKC